MSYMRRVTKMTWLNQGSKSALMYLDAIFYNSNFLAPGSAKYFVIIKLPFALQAAVMVEASQALHSSDSVDSQAYQPSSAAQSIGKEQR